MSDERLHLPTLQKVKSMFENQSDVSSKTSLGMINFKKGSTPLMSIYSCLCEMIDKEEILLKKENKCTETCPAWLTEEIKTTAGDIWNSHVDHNDNKRVLAIKYLLETAKKSEYSIDLRISQAEHLLKTFCL